MSEGNSSTKPSPSISAGEWAKEMLAKGRPDAAIGFMNLARGVELLNRNQRRAERIADTVLPDSAKEMGSDGAPKDGDEDMLRLGDDNVTINQHLPPQPTSDSPLKWVLPLAAAAGLGMTGIGIPAAGAIGYMLATQAAKQVAAPATEYEDTTVQIGLKKLDEIKDYKLP
ncbi:MAG: hypothetical protein NXI32_30025 [bacterium]|nr:hypothetical protein [bacterium]